MAKETKIDDIVEGIEKDCKKGDILEIILFDEGIRYDNGETAFGSSGEYEGTRKYALDWSKELSQKPGKKVLGHFLNTYGKEGVNVNDHHGNLFIEYRIIHSYRKLK